MINIKKIDMKNVDLVKYKLQKNVRRIHNTHSCTFENIVFGTDQDLDRLRPY